MVSTDLLGVKRSEALTWSAYQDDYLGSMNAGSFRYHSSNNWVNTGFNYRLNFGETWPSPPRYGFSVKIKTQADVAGRFEYNQLWFKPRPYVSRGGVGDFEGYTRDVTGGASLGVRVNTQYILSWGADWQLGEGFYGLGAEAIVPIGIWPAVSARMFSKNTDGYLDEFGIQYGMSVYVEAQGTVWVGKTEHQIFGDQHIAIPESHKLVYGAKAAIVFQGTVGAATIGYKWFDNDWYNDKWNNGMSTILQVGPVSAEGKFTARGEMRFWNWTWQEGYQIWAGHASTAGYTPIITNQYDGHFDRLL